MKRRQQSPDLFGSDSLSVRNRKKRKKLPNVREPAALPAVPKFSKVQFVNIDGEYYTLQPILYDLTHRSEWFPKNCNDELFMLVLSSALSQKLNPNRVHISSCMPNEQQWKCIRDLLCEFIESHNKLKANNGYQRVLTRHLRINFKKARKENFVPVDKKIVASYVCDILNKVMSKGFFSNQNRARKAFLSIISKTIFAYKEQMLSLAPVINVFKDMHWMTDVPDLFKSVFLHKFSKWLVQTYLFTILKNAFFVTECQNTGFDLFYFRKCDIDGVLNKTIKSMEEAGKLVVDSNSNCSNKLIARIRPLPKKIEGDQLRFITASVLDLNKNMEKWSERKQIVRSVKKVLKSADKFLTGIKPVPNSPELDTAWRKALKLKEFNQGVVYFIKADVEDAFGSIVHEKLFQSLSNLVAKLKISNPKKVVWDVENLISNQRLRINGKIFKVTKGLCQGAFGELSPKLCNVYYTLLDQTHFHPLVKKSNSICIRAQDDYLFITGSQRVATILLKMIQEGFSDFSTHFQLQKLTTNLTENQKFVYLGLSFNIESMFVEPNYDKYLKQNMLSSIKLNALSLDMTKRVEFVQRKSSQTALLKLFRIVLMNKFVQPSHMRQIIYKACCLHIKRTLSVARFLQLKTSCALAVLIKFSRWLLRTVAGMNNVLEKSEISLLFWNAVVNYFRKKSADFQDILYYGKRMILRWEGRLKKNNQLIILSILMDDVAECRQY